MTTPDGGSAAPASRRFRGWLRRDVLLLPVLCLLDLFTASSVVVSDHPVSPSARAWQVAAAVAAFAVLAWRRRAPVVVFAVECAHGVAVWFLLHDYRPTLALIVALYAVAASRPVAVSAGAYAAACGRGLLNAVDSFRVEPNPGARPGEFAVTALMFAVIYGTAWAVGLLTRRHHWRVEQLERDRRTARAEAVALERRRIAAELHDVVSHSVTVMVLQAAGAARLTETDPERARQALLHIQQAGQQAMAELRRLLDVMRVDAGPDVERLDPQPSLDDVEVLLASMARAGLSVTSTVSGVPTSIDPSVGLAAYRTVQESLTNTLKHAGPGARATVRLAWEQQVLLVRVEDDGGSARRPAVADGLSAGHGLASLTERIHRVGGRLTAGPLAAGGFRVTASLPIAHRPDVVLPSGRDRRSGEPAYPIGDHPRPLSDS
ncbi:Histidine kinase [Micromonospora nigra]|uniref:histidine kinase n=1 Tax=Micromonospora nigra TaxID=145857 RepID=A0A1C6R9P8_9ACTN|nr:histidine kinase [Micromonospora nigra]SCL13738.1 Histidine kinase [Micromonospora nigra]